MSSRNHFPSLGVAWNVTVKRLMRMFGPSCGVVLELRRIISNQKWANTWLVLRYIGRGYFIIMDIFWRNK